MKSLELKKALITGGNSGIGFGIAQKFVEEGAQVIISGRNTDALKKSVSILGNVASSIKCDVKELFQIEQMASEVKNRLGNLDVLVANAGVATVRPIEQTTENDFDHQVDINLKGTYFTIKNVLPLMNSGGSIILISSIAQNKGFEGMSVYGATKAAIRSLARTLAKELAGKNIRVNVISPGPIDTPVFEKMGLPEDHVPQVKDGFVGMVPLGRMGTVEDIANGARYLASEESNFVTGTEFSIDGGTAQV